MLDKLCNAFGVSGLDDQVREIILKEITPYCDNIELLKDGNIIAYKRGKKAPNKKIMVSAHTDEVGFIVKDITSDGYLKFESVGGIDDRILLSKRVFISEKRIPGIVGIKAVHMQNKEEREQVKKITELYIDIGCSSKEDAMNYVQRGDYILFDSDYIEFGDNKVKAKALDDRVGVLMLINLIKSELLYDTYFAFTVLEEIGTKGAKTAAYKINPDIAVIVEGTTCSDVYGTKPHEQSTNMGKGAAISIVDRASYSDKNINSILRKMAQDKNIKFQFKRTTMGGNDARAIQVNSKGVKTVVISVPVRYIHSPVSVMDKTDYENTFKLVREFVNHIGGAIYD